jgi:hypothetical protein
MMLVFVLGLQLQILPDLNTRNSMLHHVELSTTNVAYTTDRLITLLLFFLQDLVYEPLSILKAILITKKWLLGSNVLELVADLPA